MQTSKQNVLLYCDNDYDEDSDGGDALDEDVKKFQTDQLKLEIIYRVTSSLKYRNKPLVLVILIMTKTMIAVMMALMMTTKISR